jgi:putative acetyltransferase
MHTAVEVRGGGVGRALVAHLIEVARSRRYQRMSLETGNFAAFEPARSLYASCGFEPCDPYGTYVGSSTSACMSMDLGAAPTGDPDHRAHR